MTEFFGVPIPTFRAWREAVKEMTLVMASNMSTPRDLTPMFHASTEQGVMGTPLDALWFDSPEAQQRLIDEFVLPFIRENEPRMVAWTYTGRLYWTPERDPRESTRVAVAVVIEREVSEVWHAELSHDGTRPVLGEWESWENTTYSDLIQPVQEALR